MKRNAILFLLIMLMVACTYRKHTSDYYSKSDTSYQYESEVKEPDSVIQNIPSEEPAKSHSSSYSSIRKEKELDNMRGFDPASEDDMDDNGMQRYFDANDDDEEWVHLASTDALYNETQKCLDFYNWRRKQLSEVEPNEAHKMIAELEKEHKVTVITQNVDNLHERAGSTEVIHLHGELSKVCSMDNRTTCVKEYPLTTPIKVGDKAEDGSQLRPYIVMFGEYIDSMNVAIDIVSMADIFVVVGTSLKVYPAAGFINYAHHEVPKFVIDPGEMEQCTQLGFTHFKTTATEGMRMLLEAFKEL